MILRINLGFKHLLLYRNFATWVVLIIILFRPSIFLLVSAFSYVTYRKVDFQVYWSFYSLLARFQFCFKKKIQLRSGLNLISHFYCSDYITFLLQV